MLKVHDHCNPKDCIIIEHNSLQFDSNKIKIEGLIIIIKKMHEQNVVTNSMPQSVIAIVLIAIKLLNTTQ